MKIRHKTKNTSWFYVKSPTLTHAIVFFAKKMNACNNDIIQYYTVCHEIDGFVLFHWLKTPQWKGDAFRNVTIKVDKKGNVSYDLMEGL